MVRLVLRGFVSVMGSWILLAVIDDCIISGQARRGDYQRGVSHEAVVGGPQWVGRDCITVMKHDGCCEWVSLLVRWEFAVYVSEC